MTAFNSGVPGSPQPRLRADAMNTPHPSRLAPDRADYQACLTAHATAMETGSMGYMDPTTGLFVMTAAHLAERPCCARGCRHCPWVGASE